MLRHLKMLWVGRPRRRHRTLTHRTAPGTIQTLELRQLLSAVTASFAAAQDTTIFEINGDASNGAGQFLLTGNGTRSLLKFDVDIPEGSTVLDAVLTLSSATSDDAAAAVSVHRITKAWGESGSDALGNEQQGAAAQPFDATWLHAFYDGELWQTAGGDFAAASGSAIVGGFGSYEWMGGGLIDDVQMWVDDASTNFGWLMQLTGSGIKSFLSKDNPDSSLSPSLEITYEPPPGPPIIVEGRLWNDLNGDGLRADPILSDLDLSISNGNTHFNVFGGEEHWFRSGVDNSWFFLTSNGGLTKWSGAPRTLSGSVVATLDNIYYLQPSLVTQQSPTAEPWLDGWTVELIGSLGNVVETVQTSGRDLNGDGQIDPVTEGGWYRFVASSDDTYTVRQVIPEGWSEGIRLEVESQSPSEQAVNILELEFRTSFYLNFGGRNEKWMYSQQKGWFFITPDGNLYHWNGRPVSAAEPLTGTLVAAVGAAAYADPVAAFSGQFSSGGSTTEPTLQRIDFGNLQTQTITGRVWLDFFANGTRDLIQLIPDFYVVYPTEDLAAGEEWFYDFENDDWYVINVDGEARYWGKFDPDSDDFTRPGTGGGELIFAESQIEPWLNNRTMQLVDSQGVVIATTRTQNVDLNSDGTIQFESERGWYVFKNVPVGQYTVQMAAEEEWIQTSPVSSLQATVIALDTQLGFRTTTKDFLNWGGLNERWIMDAEDRWYYVTPEGSVYRWQVGSKPSTGGLTGTLVASLSSAHYQDLHLITEPDLTPLTVYVDPDGTSEDLLFGNHRLLDSLLGPDL